MELVSPSSWSIPESTADTLPDQMSRKPRKDTGLESETDARSVLIPSGSSRSIVAVKTDKPSSGKPKLTESGSNTRVVDDTTERNKKSSGTGPPISEFSRYTR